MIAFGIDSIDLDNAASAIRRALQLEFRPHESDFNGGPYCRAETTEGVITIQRNLDVLDNEPFEANWPSDRLVLYMDGASEDGWRSFIDALRALRDPKVSEVR